MTLAGEFSRPAATISRRLRLAAGVVFTALLVVAPLNFGSTRAGGPEILTAGCTVATLLWIAALACGRPRAQVPFAAAASAALLTLAALPWITGLAPLTSVASFTQTHFAHVAARWPYSIVWRTPASTLALTLALAAAALPLIDLARTRGWALTFSIALVATGVAVGLLALLQNYTHATGIYWRDDGRMPGNFCGTFYHHTAAGAYFNTAWPLAVGLTALAWHHTPVESGAKVWIIAGVLATVVLLAAHGSHVSRFPQLTALVVAPFLLRSLNIRNQRRWLFAAGGAVVVAGLIFVAGRPGQIRQRWSEVFQAAAAGSTPAGLPESAWPALMRDDLFVPHTSQAGWFGDRGEGWRTALRSIAERPLTGHGPGNWMGAASHHTMDPFVRTFFQFLQFTHQDFLQFAVEWGVPAALAWSSLLVGGIVMVIRTRHWLSPLHRQLGTAAACGLGAVLLQAQLDFPLQMPAVAFNVIVLTALCWAGRATLLPTPAPALS